MPLRIPLFTFILNFLLNNFRFETMTTKLILKPNCNQKANTYVDRSMRLKQLKKPHPVQWQWCIIGKDTVHKECYACESMGAKIKLLNLSFWDAFLYIQIYIYRLLIFRKDISVKRHTLSRAQLTWLDAFFALHVYSLCICLQASMRIMTKLLESGQHDNRSQVAARNPFPTIRIHRMNGRNYNFLNCMR